MQGILRGGKLVLLGGRDSATGLWKLSANPLQPEEKLTMSLDLELTQEHHIERAAHTITNFYANILNHEPGSASNRQTICTLYSTSKIS